MNDQYELAMYPGSAVHLTASVSLGCQIGRDVVIEAHAVLTDVIVKDGVTIQAGAVIGRQPMRAGTGKSDKLHLPTYIGPGCVIGAGATIYAGTQLLKDVLVGDGARIREDCLIGNGSIIGSNCTFQNGVRMGQRSRVVDLSHITADVVIGDDVFISTGVLTMNDNSFNHGGKMQPPIFADGSSVGGGAIILPGVYIGKDAIVAAGSVVTKYVQQGTTVAGLPARRFFKQPKDESLREPHDLSYDGTPGTLSKAQVRQGMAVAAVPARQGCCETGACRKGA